MGDPAYQAASRTFPERGAVILAKLRAHDVAKLQDVLAEHQHSCWEVGYGAMDCRDRVALVAGGTGTLGIAIAPAVAAAGARA